MRNEGGIIRDEKGVKSVLGREKVTVKFAEYGRKLERNLREFLFKSLELCVTIGPILKYADFLPAHEVIKRYHHHHGTLSARISLTLSHHP